MAGNTGPGILTDADFPVRRIVTGHDVNGKAVFVSDGRPPHTVTSPAGHGLSELLWLDGVPRSPDDGGESPADLHGGFPADGAIACRLIRFPGFAPTTPVDDTWLRVPGDDPAQPGLHRSETLDLMVVLDGHITLGLDDGEHALGPGDAVIQRGTVHRWRVVGEQPCTFLSVLISLEPPAEQEEPVALLPRPAGTTGTHPGRRRLVTGTDPEGRSQASPVGDAPALVTDQVGLYDLWQTGGWLRHVEQGGDDDGPWALEPSGRGISLRRVEFAAGHDPGAAGIHTTATIDVDVLLSGRLELALPTDPAGSAFDTVVLDPGDVVIQRGNAHRWRPVGPDPAAMASVMIGLR